MSEAERDGQDGDAMLQGTEATGEAAEVVSTPPAASTVTPETKLAEVQAEAARTRDQLLRTAADFENFRKRTRREVDDAQRRGRETVVKDLLPVFDNLERAAMHADTASDVKSLGEGIRMVTRQFTDTLDRMGIKRVPSVGHPFDPTVHEAIQQIESTEHAAGVVMAEILPGYVLGDYLVRAAQVVVSKGPPAAAGGDVAN
ncbi:nucleotide exchange factor GrpE [Chondromyces crocatus]|uniref:Protein GrpE n=1 Tax=Chondromyces crocatus TaxID=52 RepID=A0A0K1E5P0_CHOCO|nr:nucleotide exchange factor GrpE [Chondromyces crocatus]AKT35893.1 co-chaperone GrpE [Chondromyces crocatus]